MHYRYNEMSLMKTFCQMSQAYGDQTINPFENSRHLYVFLDEQNDKYRAATKSYFEKYMAPIFNCAGLLVDVIDVYEGDIKYYLEENSSLKSFLKNVQATGETTKTLTSFASKIYKNAQSPHSPHSTKYYKDTAVLILGSRPFISTVIDFLLTPPPMNDVPGDAITKFEHQLQTFKSNVQVSWVDFGIPDYKWIKTRYSSFGPQFPFSRLPRALDENRYSHLSNVRIEQSADLTNKLKNHLDNFLNLNLRKLTPISTLCHLALNISSNGFPNPSLTPKDGNSKFKYVYTDHLVKREAGLVPYDAFKVTTLKSSEDSESVEDHEYAFSDLDIGLDGVTHTADKLKNVNLSEHRLTPQLESRIDDSTTLETALRFLKPKQFRSPKSFEAKITLTFNACDPGDRCSKCGNFPVPSPFEPVYRFFGWHRTKNVFRQKNHSGHNTQERHKEPQSMTLNSSHLKIRNDSNDIKSAYPDESIDSSRVRILSVPPVITSEERLNQVIQSNIITHTSGMSNPSPTQLPDDNMYEIVACDVNTIDIDLLPLTQTFTSNPSEEKGSVNPEESLKILYDVNVVKAASIAKPSLAENESANHFIRIKILPECFNIVT
ncbi:uncharacterized protein LOC135929748 isoform X1 [Gordionus sp. m RMFG-2023]|uniref:uncharacterized protein LOC135929748 isoform X1 n=2 Tax=Gordionus sp. m RMFG-2023 TaxID=3053472 RepID=UPI0031FBC708